jgi:DHA1 family bicyclomycin/chloramphenicol resistance-like MFS transporter
MIGPAAGAAYDCLHFGYISCTIFNNLRFWIRVMSRWSRYNSVRAVIMLAFVVFLSADMYLPLMPRMVLLLATNKNLMQFSFSIYLLGFCISQLIIVPLSDVFGRRFIILLGLATLVVANAVCASAQHMPVFLLGRLLAGVGAAGGMAMCRVVARDCFVGAELARFASWVSLVVGLAPAVAPVMGSWIGLHLGWRAVFESLALVLLGLGGLFYMKFSETCAQVQKCHWLTHLWRGYRDAWGVWDLWCYGCVSGAMFAAYMGLITAMPFIFQHHFHLSLQEYFPVTMVIVAANFAGKFGNALLARRWPVMNSLCLGLVLSFGVALLTSASLGYLDTPKRFLAVSALFVGAMGMVFPNLFAQAMSTNQCSIGITGAIYGALQMGGAFLGSSIVSMNAGNGMRVVSLLMVCSSAFGLLMTIRSAYRARSRCANGQHEWGDAAP